MVIITRNAHGISLNAGHREVLLDDKNIRMEFESEDEARKFLMQTVELTGDDFEDWENSGGVEYEEIGRETTLSGVEKEI